MRRIPIFILLFLLSGCCAKKIAPVYQSDSIRVEIRERVVNIRDTVTFEIPVSVDRIVTIEDSSRLENKYSLSEAIIMPDGFLYHSLELKPQNVPVPVNVDTVVKDSIVYRERVEIQTIEVPRKLTWWQSFRMDFGGWVMLILLAFIGYKVYKFIKK